MWLVAIVLVLAGTVTTVVRDPESRGVAAYLSVAAFGTGVLHVLQWTAWVYVDVKAYQEGAHEALLEPLLHPFGTAHMLMFAVLIGGGVALLAWSHRSSAKTHQVVNYLGIGAGVTTVVAGSTSLLSFAPVRHPVSLATILFIAVNYAWLLVHRTDVILGDKDG